MGYKYFQHQNSGECSAENTLYKERCEELAEYLIQNQTTVRDTAAKYGISKSTVHKDITERLQHINPELSADAREILDKNKSERHLRGGEATRKKYLKKYLKSDKNKGKTLTGDRK